MMLVTESDISRSAQTAWKAVFGQPLPVAAPPKGKPNPETRLLVARIQILGSVSRTLLIVCPADAARSAAAKFFQKEASTMEQALVRDVFGELANMIGGLIKRHFPHSSRLSLPQVSESAGDAFEGQMVAQVVFECGTSPMSVRLVQNLS